MSPLLLAATLLCTLALAPAHAARSLSVRRARKEEKSIGCSGPTLLWGDEFSGATLDADSWNVYTTSAESDGGETEFYRPENVRLQDGHLVISAKQERHGGHHFTSGRVDTHLKQAFFPGMVNADGHTFGRIRLEARLKLPKGQGLWPAFWMLPNSAECEACGPYGSWPYSGEIDIVEALNDMSEGYGSLHYGDFTPMGGTFGAQGKLQPAAYELGNEWHTYALEWRGSEMRWYVDGTPFFSALSGSVSRDGWWTSSQTGNAPGPNAPFDAPFYLILNLAVGGEWPGSPDASTPWPAELRVDYVRVFGYEN